MGNLIGAILAGVAVFFAASTIGPSISTLLQSAVSARNMKELARLERERRRDQGGESRG